MLCEEARELMVAHVRRETSEEEGARLEEHLRECEACRREEERARRMLAVADAAHEPRVEERVRELLRKAVAAGASDVHFDPEPEGLVVRFRIDGLLKEVERHPRLLLQPMVDRLLFMAGLPPDAIDAARRRPAAGRVPQQVEGKDYVFRIGAFPMLHGPKVVIRIFPADVRLVGLGELGLSTEQRRRLEGWMGQPNGLVLIVGPTGAGKKTMQYSLLEWTAAPGKNVLSLESLIEAQIPGVHQAAINPAEGITFASGLRAIMRHQDPDVIMVGDVPDRETARILPEIAITGHPVIAAFEAGDAVAAARRLLDLGADPYTLSQTLAGICAQRLPRRICPQCRTEKPASPIALRALGLDPAAAPPTYAGAGCAACRKRGYKGRVGLFELLEVTPAFAQRVAENASAAALAEAAAGSLSPLIEDARRKVLDGVTTAEEALRVIRTGFA